MGKDSLAHLAQIARSQGNPYADKNRRPADSAHSHLHSVCLANRAATAVIFSNPVSSSLIRNEKHFNFILLDTDKS